ncbi:unnamed protein product [Tetraodon nigroviridis]|uniref:Ciliary neurotrophic factor n=1 Tax=Tetraodon nigroviridis TaxID=99883 RepID=Q4SJD5_TETNG|nr:unnamed protein product [Tetraodon nigroviridis]
MAVDATRSTTASGKQAGDCSRALKITEVLLKESEDLIKIYKSSQGYMSELRCKMPQSNVPNPNIAGLEPSERMASISTHLQAFFPHFRRVHEQQSDLQPPTSSARAQRVSGQGHQLPVPAPLPQPAGAPARGGPTKLPPPQYVFQQKIYGCVVLNTYKNFLSNVKSELNTLKKCP